MGDERPSAGEIRPMAEEDLDVVAEIEAATFTTPWSRRAFQRVIRDPGPVRAWVVRPHGEQAPVGYAVYWFTDHEGELANIAVGAERRGQGFGRALLERVVETASDDGVTELFLEVRASNQIAIALYMKWGFEKVGLRTGYYSKPTEDALVLMRNLRPQD